MSSLPLPASTSNPFEAAVLRAVQQLTALKAPRPINYARPAPADFLGIRDWFADVVKIMDEVAETVGHEVGENTTCSEYDARSFCGLFSGASADAVFVIEECAQDIIEQRSAA